jgi:hypothetical protein
MSPKKLLAGGLLATLLLGVTATIGIVPASAAEAGSATTCLPDGAPDEFPEWAEGAPGRSPGVSVWHDDRGWHVRATHNSLRGRVFSGVIHTRGTVGDVTAVGLERNDHVKVSADKHTIAFRFHNYGRIDGLNFTTTCAPSVQFGFLSNGRKVPTAKIAIGSEGRHPAHNPFKITRLAPSS